MIEGVTFSILMFGVIMIIFTMAEISFYLEDRKKLSQKEKKTGVSEDWTQEYFDIRNKVDTILEIRNL